jgi:hypothetical protein
MNACYPKINEGSSNLTRKAGKKRSASAKPHEVNHFSPQSYNWLEHRFTSSNQLDSTDRWPSGLRRQLKVISSGYASVSLVRKGVGSNPTLFNISFAFCCKRGREQFTGMCVYFVGLLGRSGS